MFIYFHQNRLNYEKGQMMPVFILVLVVIITMALVTVNISKIGLIKTDSSNAADAGALAGGAAMANTFNSIAYANSEMKAAYDEFFAQMSTMFAMQLVALVLTKTSATAAQISATAGLAAGQAADTSAMLALDEINSDLPCIAIGFAESASQSTTAALAAMTAAEASIGTATAMMTAIKITTVGMMLSTFFFAVAQNFMYLSIRKMAREGRKNAIRVAHQYLFNNSGITQKLKRNILKDPDFGIGNWQQFSNYQQAFALFMKFIVKDNSFYTYPWIDGQNRTHTVTSQVDIRPVDKFSLKVSNLPLPAIEAIFAVILITVSAAISQFSATLASYGKAIASYTDTKTNYEKALEALERACDTYWPCHLLGISCDVYEASMNDAITALTKGEEANKAGNGFVEAGLGTNASAIGTIAPISTLLVGGNASALGGLRPGPTFTSFSDADGLLFIIDWIEDVVHDRLVRVSTTQTHAGGDLTLWQTKYPNISSYSIVSFQGDGQIKPQPKANFDADIKWTDIYLPEINPPEDAVCKEVEGKVGLLQEQLDNLQASSDSMEANANDVDGYAQTVTEDSNALASSYTSIGSGLSLSAAETREGTSAIDNKVQNIVNSLQSILTWIQILMDPQLLPILLELIKSLPQIKDGILAGASFLDGGASFLNGEADRLNSTVGSETQAYGESTNTIREHIGEGGVQQNEINAMQAEIEQYKKDYSQCSF
ncbi:MAG: pilus assembly protein TadG-related protein [Candidatus Omnitrophica bacterium]|nr:pilus assembly protein TadG-related protein [Candidatus Omnitrophota bacterium]